MSNLNSFKFIGRPDGLGNRVEQLIKIEAICNHKDLTCKYIWVNKFNNRSYDILISCKNVEIISDDKLTPANNAKTLSDFDMNFDQKEILAAAKNIRPKFEICFKDNIRPVAVHIRASDRVGRNHPHFMKNENELRSYLSEIIYEFNNRKPKFVFVCSESKKCKDVFVSSEYADFFALTLCSEIWMASRFSSFSITASLVGNIPIFSFANDAEVRNTYMAKFLYLPITGKQIVKDKLIEFSFTKTIKNLFHSLIQKSN
jgi:hypothetical protein